MIKQTTALVALVGMVGTALIIPQAAADSSRATGSWGYGSPQVQAKNYPGHGYRSPQPTSRQGYFGAHYGPYTDPYYTNREPIRPAPTPGELISTSTSRIREFFGEVLSNRPQISMPRTNPLPSVKLPRVRNPFARGQSQGADPYREQDPYAVASTQAPSSGQQQAPGFTPVTVVTSGSKAGPELPLEPTGSATQNVADYSYPSSSGQTEAPPVPELPVVLPPEERPTLPAPQSDLLPTPGAAASGLIGDATPEPTPVSPEDPDPIEPAPPTEEPIEDPTPEEPVPQEVVTLEESLPEYPTAFPSERAGHVYSPYHPNREINVTGFQSGDLAVDPTTDKIFRLP